MLQPVALAGGSMAVTEVYVPAAEVSRGVAASWAVMTAIALVLIGVSVVVADRLATRVTRPARELALAAATLGDGDLTARSTAGGPAELAAAGHAFNVMAERLSRLIAAERVMAADLPHRLRTPLTALRMNASALGPGQAADDTRLAIDRLEQEIDLIIRAARRPAPDEPYGCDAAEVIAERFGFWSALAEDQARPCQLHGTEEPAPVPLPRSDLAAATDSLIGNIFKHTPEGTGFAVTLHRGEGAVLLLVADAGPGIADPDAALRRGSSGAGSTGLGLDIARRVAESTGGGLKIGVSALGGAQLQLRLRTWSLPPGGRREEGRRWRAFRMAAERGLISPGHTRAATDSQRRCHSAGSAPQARANASVTASVGKDTPLAAEESTDAEYSARLASERYVGYPAAARNCRSSCANLEIGPSSGSTGRSGRPTRRGSLPGSDTCTGPRSSTRSAVTSDLTFATRHLISDRPAAVLGPTLPLL